MINRRFVLGMIAAAIPIDASRTAFAKEKHHLNGKDLLICSLDGQIPSNQGMFGIIRLS